MTARNALAGFAALAHPVRLALFRKLCDQAPERASAGALAQGFDIPPSTMTGHLQALERAGLIKAERRSRFMLYSLNPNGTRDLVNFLVDDCCHNRPDLVGKDADALAQAS
ncbi:helix-turn-helix transcriptional regulator [Maricaulis sp.]|uniref:ArsR/SmtB family transcription factor n=1 Tax=Maricaulis sp. TaxID=1486257 RepID=UPI0025C6B8AB|nr:helix-turn-helix transcriptional regulator [Maricaulis sp.]